MNNTVTGVIIIIFLSACSDFNKVGIKSYEKEISQPTLEISTANATYLYEENAGGFSNIIDQNGYDWIQFKNDSASTYPESAASGYRGLPNLVLGSADDGVGHPGFNKCKTVILDDHRVQSTSKSGNWQWTWSFYNDYAVLEVEKADPDHAYWFLYEGTIGGKYQPQFHYWGNEKGGPFKDIPDYFLGTEIYDTWSWAYFGDEKMNNVFFIVHLTPDNLNDTFSYLGNSKDGIISPDGMVVFGFGRDKGTTPLMKEENNKFLIGFYNKPVKNRNDHQKIEKYISELISKLNT